jgi:Stress responsive A/B Barrel Domain
MIRHIVMFRLQSISKNKESNINILKDKLDNLKNKIPQIIDLETGVNISKSSNAYDLVLVTKFKDQQELEDYKIHPEHLLVLDYLKEVNETMTVVDYTLDQTL